MLWTKDLKMYTVHVHDLSRAIWHLFHNGQSGHIYNCVDKNNTSKFDEWMGNLGVYVLYKSILVITEE